MRCISRSRWADISPSPATRQAALSVSRDDSRTSLTSGSFVLRWSKSFLSSSSASAFFSSFLSPSISPRSAARSFLPLYSGRLGMTNSSMGSVSSSTSQPLARNASRCGECSTCSRASADQIVNLLLFRRHGLDVLRQRRELAGRRLQRLEQQQVGDAVAVVPVAADALLEDRAQFLVEADVLLVVVRLHVVQLLEDGADDVLADLLQKRVVLEHFAGNVQRQVGRIDHAA